MVALIDTNVILNYITEREDRFRESSKIVMDLCSQGKVDGFIAFHSLSVIWYSLRIPDEGKRMWLRDISRMLTVVGATHEQVLEAIENVQFKDFEMAKTKVYSPDEFVALFK